MASKRATLTAAFARKHLALAQKVDGVQMTFSHQGGTAATLWVRPDAQQPVRIAAVSSNGLTVEREERFFEIAKQTSSEGNAFAGAISNDDELTWGSDVYVVTDWAAVAYGAAWLVRARLSEVRRAGP